MLSCHEIKNWMVEYLYGEMPEEKQTAFTAHLRTCSDCRNELAALQRTQETLAEWPDAVPEGAFVFSPTESLPWRRSRAGWWQHLTPARKWGLALPVAALLFFVSLAALNTQLSFRDGHWELAMSLQPRPTLPPGAVVLNKEDMFALEQQRWQLIKTLIQESEQTQRGEWSAAMTKLAQYVHEQRDQDLYRVSRGLETLGEQTANRLAATDRVLTHVLQLTYTDQNQLQ